MKKEIPIELWLVIFLLSLFVISEIIIARYLFLHPEIIPPSMYNLSNQFTMFVILLLAIIGAALVFGLYKGFLWAWYGMLIYSVILLINSVIAFLIYYPDIFTIFIAVGLIYILYRPNVKKYFKLSVKK